MTDDQIAVVITAINDAGWNVANISQTDDLLWVVELREGHHTSYSNVIITDREANMLTALCQAERQAAGVLELRESARELGLSGKVILCSATTSSDACLRSIAS